jgi:hypothetical protein
MRFVTKVVIGVLIAMAVVIAVGLVVQAIINGSATKTASVASSPSPTPDLAAQVAKLRQSVAELRHQNDVLTQALGSLSTPWVAWTYEPSGDVRGGPGGGPMLYANIVAVHPARATISFDASQFFNGPPATAQQIRDGVYPEDEWYPRNLYQHVQTMRVSKHCAIVGWGGGTMTLPELAKAIKDHESPPNYWLFIDSSRITTMIGVYHP